MKAKFDFKAIFMTVLGTAMTGFAIGVFLTPNKIVGGGVSGISTLLFHSFAAPTGVTFFLINLLFLLISAWVLGRDFVVKTLLGVSLLSLFTQIFSMFPYYADNLMIPTLLGGALYGIGIGTSFAAGASTGGTDILAALLNKVKPSFNTGWIIFTANAGVALASYFVYGRRPFPVLMSVICSFAGGFVSDAILRGADSALKFEIITPTPDALATEIMRELKHGCTKLPAHGMYSNEQYHLLICVVNKRQRSDFERIISRYENTFAYCSRVRRTYGNFDRIK